MVIQAAEPMSTTVGTFSSPNAKSPVFHSVGFADEPDTLIFPVRSQESPHLRLLHKDFGLRVSRRDLYKNAIGDKNTPIQYIVDRPLEVAVYKNQDGYTALLSDFDSIIGYGESRDEAVAEVKTHLRHLRKTYATMPNNKCTQGAILLREKLKLFLKEVRITK